ncbi:hypothetical protein CLV83_1460 [Marinobacterium mangrovicola]|uniref:Uncharacterized protein n=1 Tax=Marinobacterium mangrovicola TaxID=1476959 RepID=A0A4R1GLI9_9GAMM|nr:hypothetical protein CLV83_1460 [Marinobacterium mangrovicola]
MIASEAWITLEILDEIKFLSFRHGRAGYQ